jgi:hypothetical protein
MMKNQEPNNECGGCTACCVVMPVLSKEFCKPVGPCQHLVPGGCGIYADRPPVCREWHCGWRKDGWLGSRPEYRPDRLGVMFSEANGALTIWEVTPGALADPRVDHIKNRLKNRYKAPGLGVRRYPLKVLDDVVPTTEMLFRCKNGVLPPAEQNLCWKPLGGNEYVLVKNEPPQDVPQRSEDRPRAGLGGGPDPRMPAQDVGRDHGCPVFGRADAGNHFPR